MMSTTRVLLKQDDDLFCFLKLEAGPDGSLYIFLARPQVQPMEPRILDRNGKFVPDLNRTKSGAKISCHTSGEIHSGSRFGGRIFIEPLYALTKVACVAFFSIPNIRRLEVFQPAKHLHDAEAIIEFAPKITKRLNFVIEMGPRMFPLVSGGVSLNYEFYSMAFRLVESLPVQIDPDLTDHFIYGLPSIGTLTARAQNPEQADLRFTQLLHNHQRVIVDRSDSGEYVAYSTNCMRVSPRLTILFDRADLRIDYSGRREIHKVYFWIVDRGGRNKVNDLRIHIKKIEFDAEL